MIRCIPVYCSKCSFLFGKKNPHEAQVAECPNCGSTHTDVAKFKEQ